jgi:hypothetical protein
MTSTTFLFRGTSWMPTSSAGSNDGARSLLRQPHSTQGGLEVGLVA